MDTSLVVGLVSSSAAIFSASITYWAFRIGHHKEMGQEAETRLKEAISMASEGIRADVRELKNDVKRIDERGPIALTAINDRVGILETKVEVFWKSVAVDAARILHSPHASRAALDELLEAFEHQRLTRPQVPLLLAKLNEILGVHVGAIVDGVPVSAGDQISAAIILRYLERNDLRADV